ncbi:MAG TPA: ABC transporter permease [Methanocella sp.]|nr:ABC transporter permease [Methanocella sp.]
MLRYKNSILGFLWSLLQPLLIFIVLLVIFGSMFDNASIEYYPLYLLLGVISWGLLDKGTNFSLNSIVGKSNLIKKIYFPREVLVLSACLTALMMTFIELIVFLCLVPIYILVSGKVILPGADLLLFPIVLLVEFVIVVGISLGIAALNVRYRDIQWIWGVIMYAGFFATPIMYSLTVFKNQTVAHIVSYNPIGVLIGLLRNTSIYSGNPVSYPVDFATLGFVIIFSVIVLVLGWLVFIRIEPTFAEEV